MSVFVLFLFFIFALLNFVSTVQHKSICLSEFLCDRRHFQYREIQKDFFVYIYSINGKTERKNTHVLCVCFCALFAPPREGLIFSCMHNAHNSHLVHEQFH